MAAKKTTTPATSNGTSRRVNFNGLWFTFALCIFACALLSVSAAPTAEEDSEAENTRQCKALCKQCGGLGFFCGDECICECNDDRSDTECIAAVQREARTLKLPFEILIQGPGKSSFVRNALQFEQNAERRQNLTPLDRNKRSTVVIYKPGAPSTLDEETKATQEITTAVDAAAAVEPETKTLTKRSTNNFEWFNDLANTFLRPAPLRVARDNDETEDSEEESRHTIFSPSWFVNSARKSLRPAPLRRRHERDQEDTEDDSIRNVRAKSNDFGETLRSRILGGTDELQSKLQNNNFGRFLRQVLSETFRKLQPSSFQSDEDEAAMDTEDEPQGVVKLPRWTRSRPRREPWFSPRRFLERVKEAIN